MQNRANLSAAATQIRSLLPSDDYARLSRAITSEPPSILFALRNEWKTCLKYKWWHSLSALLDAKAFNFRQSITMNQEFAVNKRLKKIEQSLVDSTKNGIAPEEKPNLIELLISLTKLRAYILDKLRIPNEHLTASYHLNPNHPLKSLFFCYGITDINLCYTTISLIKDYLLSKMVSEFASINELENKRQLGFDSVHASTCRQALQYIHQINSCDETCFRLFITCKAIMLGKERNFESTIQAESNRIATQNMEREQRG